MKNSAIQYYLDTLIIQASLGNDKLTKEAQSGAVGTIISDVKNYVSSKIDDNNKVSSVLNIIAPGAISVLLRSIGLNWIGFLLPLAMNVFGIKFDEILSSIHSKISSMLKAGPVSSEQVDAAVEASFESEKSAPPTEEQLQQYLQTHSFNKMLRSAHLFKMSLIQSSNIKKTAGVFDMFGGSKVKTVSLLASVVKWTIKTVIAAAGLMVAGDVVKKMVGIKDQLDEKQISTAFKLNSSYDNKQLNTDKATWVESVIPNTNNIKDFVLDWMNEVYQDIEQYEELAENTFGFRNVVKEIEDFNAGNKSGNITFIPKMFKTKKDAVNIFIKEVEDKVKSAGYYGKSSPPISA